VVVWFRYGFGMLYPRAQVSSLARAEHTSVPRIGLLVPCTKRKRGTAPEALRIHSLPRTDVCSLSREWVRRLDSAPVRRPATELYAGQGWTNVLDAQRALARQSVEAEVFVLSAGLGLIRADESIPTYSATFSDGEDQVAARVNDSTSRKDAHRRWLDLLHAARRTKVHRALRELRACDYIIAAMGLEYVEAAGDVLAGLAGLLGRNRFFLISAGARIAVEDPLAGFRFSLSTSAEAALPGARSSLNQRLLRWLAADLVPTTGWSRVALEAEITARLPGAPVGQTVPARPVRKLTDEQVTAWVEAQLRLAPREPNARLLQRLRQIGSCEQSRFGRLARVARQKAAGLRWI
jgi:hypothetical protein